VRATRIALRDVAFIELSRELMDQAGALTPPDVRSFDAIHLAAALSLGDDLDKVVTYDGRMLAAASACGLVVSSPA